MNQLAVYGYILAKSFLSYSLLGSNFKASYKSFLAL